MLLYYVGEIPHKSFRLITRLAQLVERKTFKLLRAILWSRVRESHYLTTIPPHRVKKLHVT